MLIQPITFQHFDELPEAIPMRVYIFDWILSTFLDPARGSRLIDLGSGPCFFPMKYRDHGYIVTAVDIRDNRVPDPEDMTNITFVKQNVEDAVLDDYDVISNLGLFYHMTLAQQIAMMTRTPQNSITIMETQIFEPHTQTAKGRERLTPAKDGDYWGARYTEPGNHVSTAAWDSSESFWHNPNSLLRLFRKTGFKMVMPVNPKFMSMFASRGYYILFK